MTQSHMTSLDHISVPLDRTRQEGMDRAIDTRILGSRLIHKRWKVIAACVVSVCAIAATPLAFSSNLSYPANRADLRTGIATAQNFDFSFDVNATVEAKNYYTVAAHSSGSVEEIFVSNGDTVTAGDPILRLKNPDLNVSLSQSQIRTEDASAKLHALKVQVESQKLTHQSKVLSLQDEIGILEQELESLRTLAAEGFAPSNQVKQLEGNLKRKTSILELELRSFENVSSLLDAQIASARKMKAQAYESQTFAEKALEDLTIRADVEGRLTDFQINRGQSVAAGHKIGTVQGGGDKVIRAVLDEYYFPKLELGQMAELNVDADAVPIQLNRIEPDLANGKFTVEWSLSNPEIQNVNAQNAADFQIGQTIRVQHFYKQSENSIVVPLGEFYRSRQGNYLYVMNGADDAVRRDVVFGERNNQFLEVKSGLNEGEEIIVSSYEDFGLRPILTFN